MKRTIYFLISAIVLVNASILISRAQPGIDVETGLVLSGYNNVRIPGDGGTLFSMNGDLRANEKSFTG
jgi:hypothetical protein